MALFQNQQKIVNKNSISTLNIELENKLRDLYSSNITCPNWLL